jgi:hypothetical protein
MTTIKVSKSLRDRLHRLADHAAALDVTNDQRHFRTLRPLWGATAFTLLPFDE